MEAKLKTLVNFRDIGGYKGIDGREIKYKKLLRSGEVRNLSDEDKNILINDYKLKKIIDFRSDDEVKNAPNDTLNGVEYQQINIMGELSGNTSGSEDMVNNSKIKSATEIMKEIYVNLATDKNSQKAYRKFLNEVKSLEEGSLLFHCFAGKDRTGFGALLIMKILGVKDDDIFEDYLKTNELRREANKIIIEELEKSGATKENIDNVTQLMEVDISYLEEAYNSIIKNYSSFDNYLKNVLNVDDEAALTFRNLYLES